MIRLQLTKNKVAELDRIDYDLTAFKWYTLSSKRTCYAVRDVRNNGRTTILLHRAVLSRVLGRELLPSEEVDHIDGNGLNNRRNNLRLVSHQQNMMNMKAHTDGTSIYKGVDFHKASGKWRARIHIDYHEMHLGLFISEMEAARAYDLAAKKMFGLFSNLNETDESDGGAIPPA